MEGQQTACIFILYPAFPKISGLLMDLFEQYVYFYYMILFPHLR